MEGRLTWNLVYSVLAALCGMFTFGYNTGVINSPKSVSEGMARLEGWSRVPRAKHRPLQRIKEFINEVYLSRYGEGGTNEQLESLFSYIVAAFALGGLVGGFGAGLLAERRGRYVADRQSRPTWTRITSRL